MWNKIGKCRASRNLFCEASHNCQPHMFHVSEEFMSFTSLKKVDFLG